MNCCTCTKCGWVHVAYSRAQARAEVDTFNAFYDAAEPEVQRCYGDRATVHLYEKCWCGSDEFRAYKDGDCPTGVTISPVICEKTCPSI